MTTIEHPTHITPAEANEPAFLYGQGYELTAREVLYALGSYLANFGDPFTPDHASVNPLSIIDAEVRFTGNLRLWQASKTPDETAIILARARQIAAGFFGPNFPPVHW